ncbi:MAG: hypothetical protein VB835_01765 [Pirellulales bacterium]
MSLEIRDGETTEFRCSRCGKLLRVPRKAARPHVKCPKCQAVVEVPLQPTPADGQAVKPALPNSDENCESRSTAAFVLAIISIVCGAIGWIAGAIAFALQNLDSLIPIFFVALPAAGIGSLCAFTGICLAARKKFRGVRLLLLGWFICLAIPVLGLMIWELFD